MKLPIKFLLLSVMFSSLSYAQISERDLRIIDGQKEKLTAFSYKKREGAVFVLKNLATQSQSHEVKVEVIEALQDHLIDFMTGGTAVMSLQAIEQIALESGDLQVATKAVEVLQTKLESSLSHSARVRITAAKLMVQIAESFKDKGLDEKIYDALLPHVDSSVDELAKIARERIVEF